MFLRAYVRRLWGLPGGSYKAVAEWLTAAGYPTRESDLKNARRAVDPVERAIPANAPGVGDFLRMVRARFPDFECYRLIEGGLKSSMTPQVEE